MLREDVLEVGLRLKLLTYIRSRAPGVLELLDVLCFKLYGSRALDLLFSSPSKLYSALLTYYGGSSGADYAALLLFLNPVAKYCGAYGLAKELLEAMKAMDNQAFLNLIGKCEELLGQKDVLGLANLAAPEKLKPF